MRRALQCGLFCILFGSGSALADQGDVLRQKAAVIKAEAVRLVGAGLRDEASRLAIIADDLMSLADRFDPELTRGNLSGPARVLFALNSHLQDRQKMLGEFTRKVRNPNDPALRKLRTDISDTKREIRRVEIENQNAGKIEEAASRILHLRAASVHLQQAGMLDLAGQALMKASVLDQEILDIQKKLNGNAPLAAASIDPQKSVEAEELRKEMEKMRIELEELRKQIKTK